MQTKLDNAEGMDTLGAMSSHYNFRPVQQNKLVSEPPIAAPDDHARLVEADQRFQAALDRAIATESERIAAVEATVRLRSRTSFPGKEWPQAQAGRAYSRSSAPRSTCR